MYTTAVGYAGGFTPNPTYEEVCSGRTGHTEAVMVVFDPAKIPFEEILRLFWENHDPTQGMRQGNDDGHPVSLGHLHLRRGEQLQAVEASRNAYAEQLRASGYGDITTEIAPARSVLLRRGLSPAVPAQEPVGVLRAGWDRS